MSVDVLGIKNVCFSIVDDLPETDSRLEMFKEQRMTRGFDDTELWNLDKTIARFVLPRLTRFKELTYYSDESEYGKMLSDIILAFEQLANEDYTGAETDRAVVDKGLKLFSDIYRGLWY